MAAIPITMPAAAQIAAMPRTCSAPSRSARASPRGPIRVSRRMNDVAQVTSVAPSTATTAVYPAASEHHERNDPRAMVHDLPRQGRGGIRVRGSARLGHRAGLPRIDFRHQEQRQVPENRRDGRHQQHVEIANAQKFRHQESGRTEHGRRDERAQRGGRDQSAGRFVAMTRIRWPRRRRRARLRGSDGGTRCATHQHRRQHDRPPGPRASARRWRQGSSRGRTERTRLLEQRREDREQDDERRRSGHRVAEHALRRLVEAPRQTGDIHACDVAMSWRATCPRTQGRRRRRSP